jgi:hypothetical protein
VDVFDVLNFGVLMFAAVRYDDSVARPEKVAHSNRT